MRMLRRGRSPGVVAVTASEATGAPQEAWGDTFFFYDPEENPTNRTIPFATIVTSDRVLPHPVYAAYGGWIAIVNPGETTTGQARTLLRDAHERAVQRHRPRR